MPVAGTGKSRRRGVGTSVFPNHHGDGGFCRPHEFLLSGGVASDWDAGCGDRDLLTAVTDEHAGCHIDEHPPAIFDPDAGS
jgi:hypothetical protein